MPREDGPGTQLAGDQSQRQVWEGVLGPAGSKTTQSADHRAEGNQGMGPRTRPDGQKTPPGWEGCKRVLPLSYRAGTYLVSPLQPQSWLGPWGWARARGGGRARRASHVAPAVLGHEVKPDLRLRLQGSEAQFCAPSAILTKATLFPLRSSEAQAWKGLNGGASGALVAKRQLEGKLVPGCGPSSKTSWEGLPW